MERSLGSWVLVLTLTTGFGHAAEPTSLVLERARVLAVLGSSEASDIELKAGLPGPGRVLVKRGIGREDALALRLKFRVVHSDLAHGWRVAVTGADSSPWEKSSASITESVFWTPELPGKVVTVELFSETPDNPVHLVIERIAYVRPPSAPQAIVGPTNDIKPIANFSPAIRKQGESVAQIKFVGDDGTLYNCTGYLLTQQLMLTNQHCISSESERQSAMIAFDYDHATANTVFVELTELVRSNYDLDYAVVRLSQLMARSPLKAFEGDLADDSLLYVVQHPQGDAKKVSRNDCRVDALSIDGRGALQSDFSHRCDTLGGSSGAPVFALDSHEVVGLHHLGFDAESDMRLNRAVHIRKVYDDIPACLLQSDGSDCPQDCASGDTN